MRRQATEKSGYLGVVGLALTVGALIAGQQNAFTIAWIFTGIWIFLLVLAIIFDYR